MRRRRSSNFVLRIYKYELLFYNSYKIHFPFRPNNSRVGPSGQWTYAISREHPPASYGLILLASMTQASATTVIPPSRTVVLGHSLQQLQWTHGTAEVWHNAQWYWNPHQLRYCTITWHRPISSGSSSSFPHRLLLRLSSSSPPPALLIVFIKHCFLLKKTKP